ncbi:Exo 5'-3' exonuclease (including N-terminal domain of PolI) [uncultured Caudovirales phage]|uniref:Exo 5'-3' exonuclease (Including N-terminal domain of PolI) n=1 Tax=uncultured Caudovirales phage TaxID=2100421 RepID=A0A6J5TBK1_9CAUD|nr:Exo 5'-3' exonuclease (including N-terminal domain of PolI) [uncultured Caudovirales phage]
MIAIIDFDLVAFRSAASAENEEVGIAIYRMDELLDNILQKVQANSYRAFLTGSKNFRKEIYPEYKANRTSPKPKWLQECREYAIANLGVEVATENLEADDMLGIFQTSDTIICSLDKDLLQIKGKHFQWSIQGGPEDKRWVKPDNFITQTELEGSRLFYEQCLKGDTSDNVKGVKGLGEAKAKKLLAGCETELEMLNICLDSYATEDEFLMNAQCLYILRKENDSFLKRYERVLNEIQD